MPVERVRSLLGWLRGCILLGLVWLAVPLSSMWNQPWFLWGALWFLSTRLRFWIQISALLILGLQFDVMRDWPLGIGVIVAGMLAAVLSWLSQRPQPVRSLAVGASGVAFCIVWSLGVSPVPPRSLAFQVLAVVVVAISEVWRERRS